MGISILAPEFNKVFSGQKWMPMVPAMQMFCILWALRSIAATLAYVNFSSEKILVPRRHVRGSVCCCLLGIWHLHLFYHDVGRTL